MQHKYSDKLAKPAISQFHFDVCKHVDDKIAGRNIMESSRELRQSCIWEFLPSVDF